MGIQEKLSRVGRCGDSPFKIQISAALVASYERAVEFSMTQVATSTITVTNLRFFQDHTIIISLLMVLSAAYVGGLRPGAMRLTTSDCWRLLFGR